MAHPRPATAESSALRPHPPPGHPPKFLPDQKRRILDFLWYGAEPYGFRSQVWTYARIALVIEEEFGVHYHKWHVGKLLQELHGTPQVPIWRAIQRADRATERWRSEIWPELFRRAERERRVLVFEDESGFSLLPGLVRTYAPEEQTSVIPEKTPHDHLSVMDGMTPEGEVYTLARQESLNGMQCIEFRAHLRKVAGERLGGSPTLVESELSKYSAGYPLADR